MSVLLYLIPISLLLGGAGVGAFLWALRANQFDDLEGAGARILFDEPPAPDEAGDRDEREERS